MSGSRVPPPFSARTLEARLTPSHEARTLSMRLPWQELHAVEDAAKASGKTRSEWLREAVLAHLQKPIRSRKSAPDPTLLTELVGSAAADREPVLRSGIAGLFQGDGAAGSQAGGPRQGRQGRRNPTAAGQPAGGEVRYAQDTLFEKVWAEGLRVAALSATLGALLWGWFALTLSPVQRYYFPAYIGSSLHMTNGSEPDHIAWLVKTKPKNKIDFAETEDLVPTTQGAAPFALSAHAVEQG